MDNHVGCWNAMIGGYAQCGYGFESLMAMSWKIVTKTQNQKLGLQMHGSIVISGFASQGYVCSSLLKCYVGLGMIDDSLSFFKGVERFGQFTTFKLCIKKNSPRPFHSKKNPWTFLFSIKFNNSRNLIHRRLSNTLPLNVYN